MSGLAALGGSGLARALVAREGGVLLDALTHEGPWLSRRVNAVTGEGLQAALANVDRLAIVLDRPTEMQGSFLVLRAIVPQPALVLVRPTGVPPPAAFASLPAHSSLEVGWAWGNGDPVHDTWVSRAASGAWIEAPDPGPIPVIPMADAVTVVLSLFERTATHARWPGVSTVLPELAERIAPGKVRRGWMTARWARAHGVSLDEVAAWTRRPAGPPDLPADVLETGASRR
jgi:hypothetical protein